MALVVEVKVVPRSGKYGWVLDKNDRLKCSLKSPPEKGLANGELLNSLAKLLNIPRDTVVIIAGATSKTKLVKINTQMTRDELIDRLGIARQQTIFNSIEK